MKQINPNDIDRIVSELISLEPEFGRDETKLRAIIGRLLEAKPDVKVDSQFVAKLRRELLGGEKIQVANRIAGFNSFMTRLQYALGGSAVLAAVVLVAIVATSPKGVPIAADKLVGLVSDSQELGHVISPLGPNAFGSLTNVSSAGTLNAAAPTVDEKAVGTGFGGGGRNAVSPQPGSDTAMTVEGDYVIGMPAPEYAPATMKYVGERLQDFGAESTVYRRIREIPSSALASAVSSFDNGLVRLSGLSGLGLTSVTLRHKLNGQDYWVNIDTLQGTANINLEYGVQGYEQVPAQNVSDDRVIALANQFLDSYGVNRRSYAAPVVDQSWRAAYAATEVAQMPDFVTVNYQMSVEDQPIVGWGNQPFGMQVTVDVGHMRVQNVYNLMIQRFESSSYALETDAARLIAAAEAGGMSGQIWLPVGSVSAIELGTPTLKYYQYYQYDSRTGGSNDLYVPMLFFPVLNAPTELGAYQQFVIVPLVKEILDAQQQNGIGIPTPYPLMIKSDTGGVTGSSGAAEPASNPTGR